MEIGGLNSGLSAYTIIKYLSAAMLECRISALPMNYLGISLKPFGIRFWRRWGGNWQGGRSFIS